MRKPLLLLVLLLLTLAWALPASGSVAVRLSLAQLADSADRVVVAQLDSSESAWGPEKQRIYTTHIFTVQQTLAGEAGERLAIVLPGGIVGAWGQRVAGVPAFERSTPVLLFVKGTTIVGLNQGALALDPATDHFTQQLDGVHWIDGDRVPLSLPRSAARARIEAVWGADR